MLERLFRLRDNKTTVRTEVIAGITTFMTMAYILAVNPGILSLQDVPGVSLVPAGGAFFATALAAALGSLFMAVFANYPFALAPGMGLNAFFAYVVCLKMGYSWQFALLAVFVEGLIFLALSLTPVRENIFNSIPFSLKKAVAAGIGLFIAFIALQGAKVVVANPATLIGLQNFHDAPAHTVRPWAVLALAGTLITAWMVVKKWKAAVLLGIFATWVLGMVAEWTGWYVPDPAAGFYSIVPSFVGYGTKLCEQWGEFGQTFGALFDPPSWTHGSGDSLRSGWGLLRSLDFAVVVFTFFFFDLFDTLGSLIGVSMKAELLDRQGRLPRISGALYADSVATSVGAVLGTSTTTTFVESASGVAAGGRTGLTAATAALLFLASLVLAPVFIAVPSFATAPALLVVGFYMISAVADIRFDDFAEAIPAFLAILVMPLAYSISDGIMFGVISYTLLNLFSGRARKVSLVMYALTVLFIAKYALV